MRSCAQPITSPETQRTQAPQLIPGIVQTRSPSRQGPSGPRASLPTATISPANSCPMTAPAGTAPPSSVTCRSEPQMPQPLTAITTSPGPGVGSATSRIASGLPGSWKQAARMRLLSLDPVVVGVDLPTHLPVLVDRPGRERVDLPVWILVVGVPDRGVGPDERRDLPGEVLDVAVVYVLAHLDGAGPAGEHAADRVHRVHRLELGVEEEPGAVGEVGPGPVAEEQVREARNRYPEIGAGLVPPLPVERRALAADHVEGQELVGAETRRIADRVRRVEDAVDGPDALGHDPLDPGPDELDVRLPEAAEPAPVVLQDPLAHARVVGKHLLDEVGATRQVLVQESDQDVAGRCVRRINGAVVGIAVRRVDPEGLGAVADPRLRHQEAQPSPVEGQVSHRPG